MGGCGSGRGCGTGKGCGAGWGCPSALTASTSAVLALERALALTLLPWDPVASTVYSRAEPLFLSPSQRPPPTPRTTVWWRAWSRCLSTSPWRSPGPSPEGQVALVASMTVASFVPLAPHGGGGEQGDGGGDGGRYYQI